MAIPEPQRSTAIRNPNPATLPEIILQMQVEYDTKDIVRRVLAFLQARPKIPDIVGLEEVFPLLF